MTGEIRLGVIPTIGPFMLPQLLAQLRHHYPKLKLFLKEDLSANLLQQLQEGKTRSGDSGVSVPDAGHGDTDPVQG